MPLMRNCCCCLSTKTGSIIIGVISLVTSFLVAVAFTFSLINVDDVTQQLVTINLDLVSNKAMNITNRFQVVESIVEIEYLIKHIRTILIICLVYYALYTFASLFMTYGSFTGMRCLLLPWIVLEVVPLGLQVAGIVVLFMFGRVDPTLSKGGVYIVLGFFNIVAFVIHVHWWLCPVAHFQSLKVEETVVEPLEPQGKLMYPTVTLKY